MSEITSVLNEKEGAFKVMQTEFSVIKDFRKKRHELLKELESQKQELVDTELHHKELVTRMERKFFEEKIRLARDANRKISELATKAHKEAVSNLKDTTREVYKENLRMTEALAYHVNEGAELRRINNQLTAENKVLTDEKQLHDVIFKEKIILNKQNTRTIKDLNAKIVSMEHSLSHIVQEFEKERILLTSTFKSQLDEIKRQTQVNNDMMLKKQKESRHIKRLAQHILDQRTQLEKYFMEALDTVKANVRKEEKAKRAAQMKEYNQSLNNAILANTKFPSILSFRNPAKQIETAFEEDGGKDITELSWSDKEKVLILLFAKMNGVSYSGIDEPADEGRFGSIGSEINEEVLFVEPEEAPRESVADDLDDMDEIFENESNPDGFASTGEIAA